MIVNTLKMCTGDAGPEQSLVLFVWFFTSQSTIFQLFQDESNQYKARIIVYCSRTQHSDSMRPEVRMQRVHKVRPLDNMYGKCSKISNIKFFYFSRCL